MKTNKFLFLTIFLVTKSAISFSQHPIIKHYTVDDGLLSNHVYSITQDDKGFIWLATNNGVSRFDGKNFKNFSAVNGLPDNDIVEIQADKQGRVWLSCNNGTPCYIKGNKVFTPQNDSLLKKIRATNSSCRFTRIGQKLILYYYGGDCVEVDTSVKIVHPSLLRILAGCSDKIISNISLPSGQHFYLYDKNYNKIDSFVKAKGKNGSTISFVGFVNETTFAVFLEDKSCTTFDVSRGRIIPKDSYNLQFIYTYIYRYNGLLWAACDGIGIIPLKNNCERDSTRPILFANKQVHRFLKDIEGNYWGCSLGNGLFMIPNKSIELYDVSDGLYQNSVLKMGTHAQDLFLGFNNFKIQGIIHNKIINYPIKSKPSIISPTRGLIVNKDYIVAGSNEGLTVIHQKTKKIQNLNLAPLKSIHLFGEDTLLVGTGSFCFFIKLPNTILDTLKCGKSMAVYCNKKKEIFIGNLKEILRYRKNTQNKWVINTPLKQLNIGKDLSISKILELDNKLIVGTEQQGILAIEDTDYVFINLGKGLQQINCKSLIEDRHGNLWVASFHGIHKISFHKSIHDYTVVNYSKQNGLPYEDINDIQIINDTIYAACSKGVIRFPINKNDSAAKQAPIIYITDIKTRDSAYVSEYALESYHLPAKTASLVFFFSGIDYKSLGHIQYRYRLKGLNGDWQLTSENSVKYESLPSGTYTFEVAAINSDGISSVAPATVRITIDAHWWERWPFISLITLLFFASVLLVLRYFFNRRHLKQLKEASFKKQIAEIELKALKAQINPHFIFNTLNSIQYFIGNQKTEEAELYLSKLGSLLRKTLDFSSKSEVTVEDEIKYLDNYLHLEKLRFDEHFSYSIQNNLSPKLSEELKMPPMVLQPHIENALKHSFQGLNNAKKVMDIQFNLVNQQLVCTVQDNGIGRKASLEKKKNIPLSYISKGIELSEAKLEMFEKLTGRNVQTEIVDLYRNETPIGTKVIITINVYNV